MLFAMNFEWKSTFKSKWKRFWIISLKKGAEIEVTKHVLLADEPTGHPFFKCDEMRLRWVFTVKTAVIRLKNIVQFMFNGARSTLYRSRWRGKVFKNKIRNLSQCVPCAWPSGNDTSGA